MKRRGQGIVKGEFRAGGGENFVIRCLNSRPRVQPFPSSSASIIRHPVQRCVPSYFVIPCHDTGSLTGADGGPVSLHGVTMVLNSDLIRHPRLHPPSSPRRRGSSFEPRSWVAGINPAMTIWWHLNTTLRSVGLVSCEAGEIALPAKPRRGFGRLPTMLAHCRFPTMLAHCRFPTMLAHCGWEARGNPSLIATGLKWPKFALGFPMLCKVFLLLLLRCGHGRFLRTFQVWPVNAPMWKAPSLGFRHQPCSAERLSTSLFRAWRLAYWQTHILEYVTPEHDPWSSSASITVANETPVEGTYPR